MTLVIRLYNSSISCAGRIKESLGNVYALLVIFKKCESEMREAAAVEEYVLASRLKSQRDSKRQAAFAALQAITDKFPGRMDGKLVGKTDGIPGDLSISIIKDESISQKSTLSYRSFADEKNIVTSHPGDESSEGGSQNNDDSISDQGDEHPLAGVENAEELPTPEEISPNGVASPDLLSKMDGLFGSYRTKCFFSKNWALREAAVAKTSLLVQETCFSDNNCAETLLSIIEFAL